MSFLNLHSFTLNILKSVCEKSRTKIKNGHFKNVQFQFWRDRIVLTLFKKSVYYDNGIKIIILHIFLTAYKINKLRRT